MYLKYTKKNFKDGKTSCKTVLIIVISLIMQFKRTLYRANDVNYKLLFMMKMTMMSKTTTIMKMMTKMTTTKMMMMTKTTTMMRMIATIRRR